jgi:hypothetical protein
MSEEFDPRDGPTEERARHGAGIASRDSGLGKRVVSPIERLLVNKDVTPEQAEAGRRFGLDWELGSERQASSLDMMMSGGRFAAGAIGGESRGEAMARWVAAADAVDKGRSPFAAGMSPSVLLRTFLRGSDLGLGTLSALSRRLGWVRGPREVKALIVEHLEVLAQYYEKLDTKNGRSETPHTREAALKRIVPSDQR